MRILLYMISIFSWMGISVYAQDNQDIKGQWYTEKNKAVVMIDNCSDKVDLLCGKIIDLKKPLTKSGKIVRDTKNQDENLRKRPIIGIDVLYHFKKISASHYDDGRIYHPQDGKFYDSEIIMLGKDSLEVSGCVLKFMCKTQIWKRKID